MRMFGYYAWHSFINQLRKLLKSGVVLFILACLLVGIGIGLGAVYIEDRMEENAGLEIEEVIEAEPVPEIPDFAGRMGTDKNSFAKLVLGGVVLTILLFTILMADKNAGKIFLPADVNILFSSPMSPQSVLMFRLVMQLGMSIFFGIWLLFQLPNLVLNAGLTIWTGLGLIVDLTFAMTMGTLLQVLVYLVGSNHPRFKENLSRIVYGVLGAAAIGYIAFWKGSGLDPMGAAAGLFASKWAMLIPVWGWTCSFGFFAIEGSAAGCAVSAVCIVLILLGMGFIIRRTKADFYEDAMAKTEEIAAKLEMAKESQNGRNVMKRRSKDRSDKLQRDGMKHGSGASVFFFKTMYNRFRFAKLGIFTKTTETYLAITILFIVLSHFFTLPGGADTWLVFSLAGAAFFRALGNPLEQDTKMGSFVMIPESARKKLFFSLMGGSASCLLDLLPAVILGIIFLPGHPAGIILWLPFILTVDCFSTIVGAFIDLSVPAPAGSPVKQLVQVFFVYFGLLPDIVLIIAGFLTGYKTLCFAGAAVLNLIAALVFFLLAAVYLEPSGGKPAHPAVSTVADIKKARRAFSVLGLGCAVILVLSSVLQIGAMAAVNLLFGEAAGENPLAFWLVTFVPIYAMGVPAGLLIMRRVPAAAVERRNPTFANSLRVIPVCFFMMIAGNLLGAFITTLIGSISGTEVVNPIMTYAGSDSLLLKVLFLVILAPVIEEYIFRRVLIDRMRPYGTAAAVFTSAAMFALFHGNFSQMFYAFGLGAVFGYVYLHTGKLRCSIALHMLINALGSVIAPWLMENALAEGLTAFTGMQAGLYAYVAFTYIMAAVGIVVLLVNRRSIVFPAAGEELPQGKRFSTIWLNFGMAALVVVCLALVALTL